MGTFWIRDLATIFLFFLLATNISYDYASSENMGTYAGFAAPDSIITRAYDINDAGQIVGNYSYHSGESHGFLCEHEIYTTIRCPGAWWMSTTPCGINNAGDIAGYYYNRDLKGEKAFLYSSGSYTTMVVPGSVSAYANDINDAGQIVGSYFDGSRSHGFLYSEGIYTTLSFPGAISTRAMGINDAGQIVGLYRYRPSGGEHSFLYSEGIYTTLSFPGAISTRAMGINDAGQIVGSYFDGSRSHGFLYTIINAHYERRAI